MLHIRLIALAVIVALMLAHLGPVLAGEKGGDTIILGGEHGCGPKLVLKGGGKKKGDILVMSGECKKKHQEHHYIPYPVYHHYGGHDDYGHDYGHY